MANAKRDQNSVPTLLGVSNADGITPVVVYVDPSTHRMLVAMSGGTLAGLTDVTLTSVAQGDLLYNNGVAWVNLPHGTSGQFLQTQGAAANPQWTSVVAGAAGSDKQVQFNDGGTTLAGNAGMTFTKATGNLAATLFNNITLTTPASTATLTLGSGKTIAISASLTLAGTDSTTMTFPSGSDTVVTLGASQTLTSKTLTSPTLTTPVLGVATATSINKVAITAPASSATLTIADGKTLTTNNTLTLAGTDGKTLTISNSLALAGTDSTTMTFPSTSATIARTDAANTFTGIQTISTFTAPSNASVNVTAGSYNTIQTYTPAGAATATLDLSKGNVHHITMPAGNITIALSNTSAGQCFIIRILQDSGGSRTVTWFTTIRWAGGGAPTLTTTASKADTFGFEVTAAGSTYDGFIVGQNI